MPRKKNSLISLAILMLLIANSIPCLAQPSKRTRLKAGAKAPFAGVLMSDAALAKLITNLEAKKKLAELDAEKLSRDLKAEQKTNTAICDAKVAQHDAKWQSCVDDRARQKSIYETALAKCSQTPPWYKSPMFSFIMGNVVAGGVCGVSAGLGSR